MSNPAELSPELREALRLTLVPGVGPRIRQALLERFGSPEAVFQAAPSQLRDVPGVGTKLLAAILQAAKVDGLQAEWELCQQHGVRLVGQQEKEFPQLLREIPDPPALLYLKGQLLPQDALSVALVGSRHSTHYGQRQAERLAASLARAGLTIVSGLARGIDAAAHRGALAAGGRTLAVLGHGLKTLYPPEHQELAEQVAAQGALISEMAMQVPPLPGNFPQRNRIVSGICLGVIVVEAADRSGALSTARHASEQGRDVFAVPGPVDSRMSRGCHQLIRDGAKLVEDAEDVLEELGPLVAAAPSATGQVVQRPAELLLNEIESKVLSFVGNSPTLIDHVLAQCELPASQVLSTLSVLEVRRLVKRHGGQMVSRL